MTGSVQRNSSDVVRTIATQQGSMHPMRLPSGELAWLPGVRLDDEPVTRTLRYVVRGLAYRQFGRRLPLEALILINRLPLQDQAMADLEWESWLRQGAKSLCVGQVFESLGVTTNERPTYSLWFLRFLGSMRFQIATDPPPR
ncbi:MAG: hypothetical protein ACLQUY_19290 [Ktedonobacterales bacterium]